MEVMLKAREMAEELQSHRTKAKSGMIPMDKLRIKPRSIKYICGYIPSRETFPNGFPE
jgi:hypothetical protein